MLRIVTILVLIAVKLAFGCPQWLADPDVPGILRAMAYPLFHVNIFHLAANGLSFWVMFRPGRRQAGRDLLTGYAISCLVFPLASTPVAGISNLLYAVIGMRTPGRFWTMRSWQTVMVVALAMSLLPGVSGLTHAASFAAGAAIAAVRRYISMIDYEIGKGIGR